MIDRKILLRDHQAYLIESTWVPSNIDGIPGDYDVKETKVNTLVEYLGLNAETGDNFTFGDLWILIRGDMSLYNCIFRYELGKHKLEHYDEDFSKEPSIDEIAALKSDEDSGNYIKHLEVSICYDYNEYYKDDNKTDQMHLYRDVDFRGIGPQKGDGYNFEEGNWSLEFMSINLMKNYPLKINNRVYIQEIKEPEYKAVNLLNENTISEITVYDMLKSIFYEITFFGTPENKRGIFKDLTQAISDAKESLEKDQE